LLNKRYGQSYRAFMAAAHQTCLAHLLRRRRTLLLDHPGQHFVSAVKQVLQAALATRDGVLATRDGVLARRARHTPDGSHADDPIGTPLRGPDSLTRYTHTFFPSTF
jgi:hypothetical protein